MKKTVSFLLALAIIVTVFAVIPSAYAKKAKHYYVYTDSGRALSLYSEPSSKSKVLLKIPYGDEFFVSEKYNNQWVYGHWGGCFGYVKSRNLVTEPPVKPTKKPAPKPTTKPTKKPEQDDSKKEMEALNAELKSEREVTPFYIAARPSRATGWVNFRVGPGKGTSRIATLYDGHELKVVAQTNNWYRAIDLETGKTGYVNKPFTLRIIKDEEEAVTVTTSGKKRLGSLNINGAFTLQCDIPDGYDLQVVNIRGDRVVASILSENVSRPQMYLTVAFDEAFAYVDRMNDMSEEDLAILENSFRELNEVEISYRETGYGTKLLMAREIGSDTDFVDFVSVYKGYFIEFNMSPNPEAADQTLTEEQIKTCIDFLTNLDFIPIVEESAA